MAVVVDYAHTDDALKNLLETARALSKGRMLTVFGCGGDRDRTKRPLMGAVAGRLSDVVDHHVRQPAQRRPGANHRGSAARYPRCGGASGRRRSGARAQVRRPEVLSIVDRGDAIARAVEMARSGDLVIVAGKGHEKTQVIGDRELPFDDVDVSRAALRGGALDSELAERGSSTSSRSCSRPRSSRTRRAAGCGRVERIRSIAGFTTDSRRIVPGQLFIALRGERFDGATFATASLKAGACGVLVPVGDLG